MMRSTTRRTATALATMALALAACGTDGNDTAAEPGATAPTAEQSSTEDPGETATPGDASEASGPAEQTSEVDITGFRFAPANIEVATGTTVTWTNLDATAHTVTAGSGDAPENDEFDERVDGKDATIERTFEEPGTYAYFCALHPFMEGTVTVTG